MRHINVLLISSGPPSSSSALIIVFSADVVEAVLLGAGEKLVTDSDAIFDVPVYLLLAAFTVR